MHQVTERLKHKGQKNRFSLSSSVSQQKSEHQISKYLAGQIINTDSQLYKQHSMTLSLEHMNKTTVQEFNL